jgi:predicted DNA-binding transcriptional regulator AlpA
MSRRRTPPAPPADVLGVSDIARLCDVAKNTAWRWTKRGDFPKPAARLPRGPVWKRADIEKWKKRLPLPQGRPPREDG